MRRFLKLLSAVVLTCFLLTGCISKSVQLKDKYVVQAVGIDIENGNCNMSFQTFNTAESGGAGAELKGNLTTVYTATGKSVFEAVRNNTAIVGRKPFFAHNRIIVIGEETAKQGLENYIDFFVRDHDNRVTVLLAVAKGKAENIVKSTCGKSLIPAEEVEKVLESGEYSSKAARVEVADAISLMQDKYSDIYIPVLTEEKGEKEGESFVKANGTAIFKDTKVAGYLNEDETRGMLFIINKIQTGIIVADLSKGRKTSFEILRSKTKVDVSVKNGVPTYDIKISCAGNVGELDNNEEINLKISQLNVVKEAIQKEIETEVSAAIQKCLYEYDSDVFKFGRMLMWKDPKYFKTVEGSWHDQLKKIKVNVSTDVTIKRLGQEAAVKK